MGNVAKMDGMIPFPCCSKEKAGYYSDSHGHSSIKCPRCGKYAIFDWDLKRSYPGSAERGASHKYNCH